MENKGIVMSKSSMDWYYKNRAEVNRKRRERYKSDTNYRLKELQRSRDYACRNPDIIRAKKKEYWEQNKVKHRRLSYKWQSNRIQVVIRLLGSKCIRCGFNNLPALQIHHKTDKDRKLDFLKLDYDLNKLELLCANCHMIEHYNKNYRK